MALSSSGHTLVVAYLATSYVLPLILNLQIGAEALSAYRLYPPTIESATAVLLTYVLFVFFLATDTRLFPRLKGEWLRRLAARAGTAYLRLRPAIAIVSLPIAILFWQQGLNSYRYEDTLISQSTPLGNATLLAGVLLHALITIDVFYWMFVRPDQPQPPGSRFQNVLLASTLVVTANGTLSLFQSVLALLWALWPSTASLLFFRSQATDVVKRLSKAATASMIITGVLLVTWYFGSIIKLSSTYDIDELLEDTDRIRVMGIGGTDATPAAALYYFIERYSVYYHSHNFTSQATFEELQAGYNTVLEIPLRTLAFRFDYLTGGYLGFPRPDIGSIAQLNYQLLASNVQDRQGTAPGVIAAFDYVVPFPLGIPLCALYLKWMAGLVNDLVGTNRRRRPNLVGILLIMTVLQTFFQSPFDILMVLDDSVAFRAALFAMALSVGRGSFAAAAPIQGDKARRLVVSPRAALTS